MDKYAYTHEIWISQEDTTSLRAAIITALFSSRGGSPLPWFSPLLS